MLNTPKRTLLLPVLVSAAGVYAALAIAGGPSRQSSPAQGRQSVPNGVPTHIAQHDGTDFAVTSSPGAPGKLCYLATISRLQAATPAVTVCSEATASFPSAGAPVLDLSVFTSPAADETEVHAIQIQGFVTNVVKRVVVITASDRHYPAPLQDNTYATGRVPPAESILSIIAFDASGTRIYNKSLTP